MTNCFNDTAESTAVQVFCDVSFFFGGFLFLHSHTELCHHYVVMLSCMLWFHGIIPSPFSIELQSFDVSHHTSTVMICISNSWS